MIDEVIVAAKKSFQDDAKDVDKVVANKGTILWFCGKRGEAIELLESIFEKTIHLDMRLFFARELTEMKRVQAETEPTQ